jgi:small subunit ribosomal protein S6
MPALSRDETTRKENTALSYYENVFIARQDISQPQAEALGEAFAKVIADLGGKVTKREYWGLRNLAFRIKKNRKGHYILLNIDAPAAAVHEMERQMRINEDVVRHLTVRVEALEEEPSAMMRARDQRDERPGRGDRFGSERGDRFGGDRDRPRRPRGDEGPGRDAGPDESIGGPT